MQRTVLMNYAKLLAHGTVLKDDFCKSKNRVFCFCPLHREGGVAEEGEFLPVL